MLIAIVAEYNPFHNGHKYQIEILRKKFGYDAKILAIMSSSFVQRGEPAIIDKFKRAELAIKNGVNLVIELPFIFACQNAEIFAKGAIGILRHFRPDILAFGAEGDLFSLKALKKELDDIDPKSIKKSLKSGNSYIRSISENIKDKSLKDTLKGPNNILAIEYLRAMEYFSVDTEAFAIKRSIAHDSDKPGKNFSSASLIRDRLLRNEDFKAFIPYEPSEITENKIHRLEDFFEITKYKLITDRDLRIHFDYEEGLENRLLKYMDASNFYKFIEDVSSKRYTKSRIRRLLINHMLNCDLNFIKRSMGKPYIRILGSDASGFKILNELKNRNIVYLTKFNEKKNLTEDIRRIADFEEYVSNIYNLNIKSEYRTFYVKKES